MSGDNKMRQFLVLVSVMALAVMPACTKKGQESTSSISNGNEILIGEVGSLTGGEATFGMSTKMGVDMAIDELNSKGGIKGKKLRVVVLDDQGKPDEAATAVTKLITQDKVAAIVGEVASSRSLAMAPIAQANKIPMVSPSSTNPRVTQVGDYIFRVCFIDPFQGAVMANFASKSLKAKTAAILRDIKSDYSVGLSKFFIETFEKLGGKIVVDQSYSSGDVDFKSQLTAIKAKNPDVIFVPGYYTEAGLIARQAKEIGLKAPLLGGDGWDSSKLVEIGGPAMDGNYFSNHYASDDQSPVIQNFISAFKSKFKEIPDGIAVLGYDALMVLGNAMKNAKSLASEDVRKALAETKNYPGVSGNITINQNRDAEKPAVVLRIEKGKYIFKERIAPSS